MTDLTPVTDLSNPNVQAACIAIGQDPDVVRLRGQVWELTQRVEDLAVLLADHRHCGDCETDQWRQANHRKTKEEA